jgi:cytidylate kinase
MPKTFIKFLEPFEKEMTKDMPKKRGLVITVSGSASTGKSTAAKAIAEKFGLEYISAGKVSRGIAAERGMTLENFSAVREAEVDYEIEKRTLMYAIRGGCVIDARLSGWVAGKWADVKIFFECSLPVKAKRIAKRDGITAEEAKKNIEGRDREDNKKYMSLYGVDQFDKSIYDIIIDNDNLTLKEVMAVPVDLVKKFLERKKL